MFYHTRDATESKMEREMLGSTAVETAVGGREGSESGFGYVRLWSPMLAHARLWSDRSTIGKCHCRWLNAW